MWRGERASQGDGDVVEAAVTDRTRVRVTCEVHVDHHFLVPFAVDLPFFT